MSKKERYGLNRSEVFIVAVIGLVGNQNSGKTTLFNALTGANQKVGNWPGVTIERKEGKLKKSDDILVDLPGIYSLSPYSLEEGVSRSFVLNDYPNLIINIVDATSLERSLYLTTQLLELDSDVIVALNMSDILKKENILIDEKKLSSLLGVTVIKISAKTGEGINDLIETIKEGKYLKKKKFTQFFPTKVESIISEISSIIKDDDNRRFKALKILENDPNFSVKLPIDTLGKIKELENEYQMDQEEIVVSLRYNYIEEIKKTTVIDNRRAENKVSISDKLDKIFLNKYAAIPIFLVIMLLIYLLSVGIVGGLTVNFVDALFNGSEELELNLFGVGSLSWTIPFAIDGLGPLLSNWLSGLGASDWATSLVSDGIIAGVGAVCNFIPQIMIMFLCLSLLETSGYMSRIAFFLDRIFHNFGLSGKSLIPFIVGVGCSVPGIMSTRTIEDKKERELTAVLTPFMPCSAKLPIISIFATFFFPSVGWLISFSFYLLAVLVILVSGIIIKKIIYKNQSHMTFISELPEYKAPIFSYVMRDVGDKTWAFIKRAGTIILLCSVIVWWLSSFTWDYRYVGTILEDGSEITIDQSMLAGIGNAFAWIFYPMLGMNWSWAASVSAIQGLVAKEQVVGSLATIAHVSEEAELIFNSNLFSFFTPTSAYAYMTFNLFSAPCFGAIGAMRTELGSTKKTVFAILFQTGFAWLLASLIGTIGWLFTL